jgi:serine protease Do
VQDVPRDAAADLGLGTRRGALVISVGAGDPAAKAGIKPGDVIIEFNGKPVTNRNVLVKLVMATKPGTNVPIKVVQDKQEKILSVNVVELDLEAEAGGAKSDQEEETGGGFGISPGPLGADAARRLQLPAGATGVLVTNVDPSGPAARAGVRPGDVILQINRRPVGAAADASRALQAIRSGGNAFLLLWKDGQETFLAITKE